MNKFNLRKFISVATLLSYLCFFIISTLHYHIIEVNLTDEYKLKNFDFDEIPAANELSDCSIFHSTTNRYSTNSDTNILSPNIPLIKFLIITDTEFVCTKYYNISNFRAPPSIA